MKKMAAQQTSVGHYKDPHFITHGTYILWNGGLARKWCLFSVLFCIQCFRFFCKHALWVKELDGEQSLVFYVVLPAFCRSVRKSLGLGLMLHSWKETPNLCRWVFQHECRESDTSMSPVNLSLHVTSCHATTLSLLVIDTVSPYRQTCQFVEKI